MLKTMASRRARRSGRQAGLRISIIAIATLLAWAFLSWSFLHQSWSSSLGEPHKSSKSSAGSLHPTALDSRGNNAADTDSSSSKVDAQSTFGRDGNLRAESSVSAGGPHEALLRPGLYRHPTTLETSNFVTKAHDLRLGDCQLYPAPMGRKQACCVSETSTGNGRLTCLPNLVVVGAQKGGTTALHSYLLMHPNLRPSNKKELHLYDFDKNWKAYSSSKLGSHFESIGKSETENSITFESTPSYTSAKFTCQRMAEALPKTTRFVMIIRDPVKRVWSEINMKLRRVQNQQDYIDAFVDDSDRIRSCLLESLDPDGTKQRQSSGATWSTRMPRQRVDTIASRSKAVGNKAASRAAQECLPKPSPANKAKHSQLVRRWIPRLTVERLENCFEPTLGGNFSSRHRDRRSSREFPHPQRWRFRQACFSEDGVLKESSPNTPAVFYNEAERIKQCTPSRASASSMRAKWASTRKLLAAESRPLVNEDAPRGSAECRQRLRDEWCSYCFNGGFTEDGSQMWLPTGDKAGTPGQYMGESCLRSCLKEVYAKSVQISTGCSFPRLGYVQADGEGHATHPIHTPQSSSRSRYANRTPNHAEPQELSHVDECTSDWCPCFPKAKMISDISKNFLWRGMYEAHLDTCLRYIEPERVLIIDNEGLRNNPKETMNLVFEHAGVKEMDTNHVTRDDLDKVFTEKYPMFEQVTGWARDAQYSEQIGAATKQMLKDFYREPNERLFDLIRHRFEHWT